MNWSHVARALEAAGCTLTPDGHRMVGRNPANLKQVCAYCGKVLREGAEPVSHGMCPEICVEARKMGWGK